MNVEAGFSTRKVHAWKSYEIQKLIMKTGARKRMYRGSRKDV